MAARKPFLLRLKPEVHKKLQAWAEQELRSLNGQIEYLLREALRKRGGGPVGEGSGEESCSDKNSGDRSK